MNLKEEQKECSFCKAGKDGLLRQLPPRNDRKDEKTIACHRGIYEDEYCIATLAPEQYERGHTLVILKNYRKSITDDNISKEELSGFIHAIHKIAKHLKLKAQNEIKQTPERIYICCLCDDKEHLHVHLVPRYPLHRDFPKNEEEYDPYQKFF